MDDEKLLDHLINVLYEAVLEPDQWHRAVAASSEYLGGVNAQLSIVDKSYSLPPVCVAAGMMMSEKVALDYVNHFIAIDPHQSLLKDSPVHEWRSNNQYFDKKFISNSAFYQDFLLPEGFHYGLFAVVDETDEYLCTFGITRTAGQKPFDDRDSLAAQRFSQHLQRALRLQKHTQKLQVKAQLGAMAIDALAMPMLIVDNAATILHLNSAADYLLSQKQSELICKNGKLCVTNPAKKNQLASLIAAATHIPAVGGGLFLQVGDVSQQLFATPLAATSVLAQDFDTPLALVFVVGSGKHFSALQLLGTLYDLSPAELRVATALANGKSIEQCAHEGKVSFNTVRTQLQNVFRKTGTSRQPELVALLSQLPQLHQAD